MSAPDRSAGHPAWMQNLERANAARVRTPQKQLGTEGAMRLTLWAMQFRRFPTPLDIMDRWHVCRATAYRLRASLAAALGVIPPRTPEGESNFAAPKSTRAGH